MRTNDLRKMIKTQLDTYNYQVYYRIATDNAMYPHIVFELSNMSQLGDDFNRYNYDLIIDIYDKNTSNVNSENLADNIIDLFKRFNHPTDVNYPTIYFESYAMYDDEDKTINHKQLRFEVQTYER